jgi:hypothetical protein
MDFDGAVYNIYSRESATHYAYVIEETTGELLNDTVFERNERIAERFDISFSESTYKTHNLPVTNIQSGDNTFALMNVRCNIADTLGREEMCLDVSALEYIDLTKPYWDMELTKQINVGDRMFTAIGASNMSAVDFMTVLLFNKSIAEELSLENLYDAVREGRWTLDLFGEYALLALSDVNGDGMFNETDRYGAVGSSIFMHCTLVPSCQAWYIKKDADNLPVFEMSSDEHFMNVFGKILSVLNSSKAWYVNKETGNDQPQSTTMFRNGQGLFMGSQTFYIDSIRDMEYDFGILPFPKYNEAQDEYYSRLCFYDAAIIPVTTPDLNLSSVILEALSCDSYNTLIPAYKEKVLKSKFVRDEDSSQMLDIVLMHRVVDMGDTIFCETIRNGFINPMFYTGNEAISSQIEKNSMAIQTTLQTMIEEYLE